MHSPGARDSCRGSRLVVQDYAMSRIGVALIALVLSGIVVATFGSDAQAPPVKIGLLLQYTGPLSVQGNDATRGLELHVQKIARAGGREIQVVKEDTEAKPDVGLT